MSVDKRLTIGSLRRNFKQSGAEGAMSWGEFLEGVVEDLLRENKRQEKLIKKLQPPASTEKGLSNE